MLSILVGLEKAPSAGKVFKAWLVDTKASSYLSLGEVSTDGKLTFNQNIGKPHAYNQILLSEESPNSSTPKPSRLLVVMLFELHLGPNLIFLKLFLLKFNLHNRTKHVGMVGKPVEKG